VSAKKSKTSPKPAAEGGKAPKSAEFVEESGSSEEDSD